MGSSDLMGFPVYVQDVYEDSFNQWQVEAPHCVQCNTYKGVKRVYAVLFTEVQHHQWIGTMTTSTNGKQKHDVAYNATHTKELSTCTWRFPRKCITTNGDRLNYLPDEIETHRECRATSITNLTYPHYLEAWVN